MNSSSRHRRARKIRRTGRHTAPSQLLIAAGKAGKATPAMAIAGVLVAAPQAHAAAGHAAKATTAVAQIRTDALLTHDARAAHQKPARRYTVRRGDTLSSIAQQFYGSAAGWNRLYQANRSVLHNPNMIVPGQVLDVPGHLPAATRPAPRAAPVPPN